MADTPQHIAPTDDLPATGYVRLPQVLKVYPVGRSTWWEGVKCGAYPQPVKLGERTTAWRVEDIRRLLTTDHAAIAQRMREARMAAKALRVTA